MESRGILTILEIARHPKFYRGSKNAFKPSCNTYRNGRAALKQVRSLFRRFLHAARELYDSQISLVQNVTYGVARS
jgi:hypothetical protein